jgi:ribonuclease HI
MRNFKMSKKKSNTTKEKSKAITRKTKLKDADYIVYTDGGCTFNPGGPGGYGCVIISTETGEIIELSQGFVSTTNNRMEIMAVLAAFEYIKKGKIRLYMDSQYVLNTIAGLYRIGANFDLWDKIFAAKKHLDIELHWVKGHNGDRYNERCDELAAIAREKNNLLIDSGYSLSGQKKIPPKKTGSMGVEITLPEEYMQEEIDDLSLMEYADVHHVNLPCAEKILDFAQKKTHAFKDYANLKTDGIDYWSRKKKDQLIEFIGKDDCFPLIESFFLDEKQQLSCLKWYCRGLPLKDAIRKQLVDNEITDNCLKSRY